MGLRIRFIYMLSLAGLISCSSQIKGNCKVIKIKELYYKDVTMLGTVKLFTPLECDKAEQLNKLIIQESSWILIDMNIDNIKLYLKEHGLINVFTLDSINYHNVVDENYEIFRNRIETKVFFISENLMTYSVTLFSMRDKGSPYYEYINIDVKNEQMVDFNTLIDVAKENKLKEFISLYSVKHKEKVIDNYLHSLSEHADQLLVPHFDVFDQSFYNLKKVKFKETDTNDFSHFTADGVVFKINVIDENFLLDEERQRIEEYTSFVVIPYNELMPYMKDKKLFNTK